jgi:hypothetical protein
MDDSLIRQELEIIRNQIDTIQEKLKNMEEAKIKTSDELIDECNNTIKIRNENKELLRDKAKGEAEDSESFDSEELGV